jgi:flagellar hook-associated protein 1 FlgK
MVSSFSGLSTALTGLSANRRGLDVTAQNIANANTEGYTRQRIDFQALGGTVDPALWSTFSGAGDGVGVTDVTRMRDAFLDARNQTEHGNAGFLTNEKSVYGQIEQMIIEPSDNGLQAQLSDVWASWHDVGNNPGDLAARATLLEQTKTVTTSLNTRHDELSALFGASYDQLRQLTVDVNNTAGQIAGLNAALTRASTVGLPANELADQRDQLVLHLADLTGGTALRHDNGTVDVLIGGSALVSGTSTRTLAVIGSAGLDSQSNAPVGLQWTDHNLPATLPNGQMGSVLQSLTTTIPHYSGQLDQVAAALANTVNAQHAQGYDLSGTAGGPFFSGTTAATIRVAISDPAKIAAAGTPGGNLDGGNAAAIAGLAAAPAGADLTYRQLVADLGATTSSINQRAGIQLALSNNAEAAVASASGVSLDEEMTNMIMYQRGYEAAARVVSTVDSVLDTLINHTIP